MSDIEDLRERWRYLYSEYLPSLATAKDSVQGKWPVSLDHCFARIILDEAVGGNGPWTETIKAPAIKHMTKDQFKIAIELAEDIATGEKSLVFLNDRSLAKRNKKRKPDDSNDSKVSPIPSKKQKTNDTIISYFQPSTSPTGAKPGVSTTHNPSSEGLRENEVDMDVQLKRIADSDLSGFRKQALRLLCEIPRGRFSTYQAMSDFITKSSHKTCARAVGNSMKNNPFAPEVPCHRVLASDGSLGGFKGHWGEEGKFAGLKHRLLHEEGVRFDSQGKVKGRPFREFKGI